MLGHWTWKGASVNPDDYLGFIYVIKSKDWYYVGRKQIWSTRRGKRAAKTRWKNYRGSSRHVAKLTNGSSNNPISYEILGFFHTKSFLRYAEAFAILTSLSYERPVRGINYSFDGAKGALGKHKEDEEMMRQLKIKVRRLERDYR